MRDHRATRETSIQEIGRRATVALDYFTLTPTPACTDFRFTSNMEEHHESWIGRHPAYDGLLDDPTVYCRYARTGDTK